MNGYSVGSQVCGCKEPFHVPKLIAVTGGPGAGKTAVLELARRAFCEHVAILPESAGIVFGGGFPRHDTEACRVGSQLAIFHVQRSLERVVVEERIVGVALCDRGTLDGLAYWPKSAVELFEEVGSSIEREYERYAAVIHLRAPSLGHGYNHQNRLRIESADQARVIDQRIAEVWSGHPYVVTIGCEDTFEAKAHRALEVVRDALPACCRQHQIQ